MFQKYEKTYRLVVPDFTLHGKRTLSHDEARHLLTGNVVVEEKLDGCLHYNTRITLADGSQELIGKIVRDKLAVEVLSFNFKKQKIESKKIVNWYNHGHKKPFIALKVISARGSRPNIIICTPDHLFYTDKGYIEAQKLKTTDAIYTFLDTLSFVQKQLILGTLLGDGSIYPNNKNRNNGLVYAHSIKQQEYCKLKDKLLGVFFNNSVDYITGYGSKATKSLSICHPAINNIISICYCNNKKTVTDEWLNELSPIALAFWYQDDGSLSHSDSQKDRAVLHTQGFSENEVNLIITYFKSIHFIKASKVKSKNGYFISFDTVGSEKFFNLIAPYIHTSMQYKLPKELRASTSYWDTYNFKQQKGLVKLKFLGRDSTAIYSKILNNYDIEVEDNHNYLANNILVHNSNTGIIRHKQGFSLQKRGSLVGQSEHAQFQYFHAWANRIRYTEIMSVPVGFRIYGELLYAQHTIYYGALPDYFIVIDIQEGDKWLNRGQRNAFCNEYGFVNAPLIAEGNFKITDLYKLIPKVSAFGFSKAEGIVIKKYNKNGYWRAKLVRPEFVLKLDEDDEHWSHGALKLNKLISRR